MRPVGSKWNDNFVQTHSDTERTLIMTESPPHQSRPRAFVRSAYRRRGSIGTGQTLWNAAVMRAVNFGSHSLRRVAALRQFGSDRRRTGLGAATVVPPQVIQSGPPHVGSRLVALPNPQKCCRTVLAAAFPLSFNGA